LRKHLNNILLVMAAFILVSAGPKSKKISIKNPEGFCFIPDGDLSLNHSCADSGAAGQEIKHVNSFYISATEVTNKQYNSFLEDLKNQGKIKEYERVKVQSEYWGKILKSVYQPLVNNYHNSVAYEDFPVVNIPKEGAELYCKWLTEKFNNENPNLIAEFRLPTGHEWIYAAQGGANGFPYSSGLYLINFKNEPLANFFVVDQANIYKDKKTGELKVKKNILSSGRLVKDKRTVVLGTRPLKVDEFFKNRFGLYNMCGNVAEMLSEEGKTKGGSWNSTGYYLQIEGDDEYEGFSEPSPFIGFRPVASIRFKD
jgi:formylglycine-generating enzyme required for sulfatase activity